MKLKFTCCSSVLLLFAVLGLTACSGSHKSAAMTAADSYNMVAETAAYTEAADSYEMAAEAPASAETAAPASGVADTASTTQSLPANRKLIRNVDINVETDTFDQLLNTLTAQISELGGYVEQSQISGNSLNYLNEVIPRSASLTARVPIDKLDGFITVVEDNGNVTNKSESTQDVTLQYSDIESRKKSLTVEQDRIWALLEKADTLESVIALEARLSEIRYQLESMESQLRLYDNQVDYSTVYLYINEIKGAADFTPTEPENFSQRIQNGFTKNLKAISQGLTNFFIWLVTSSPFWLPLALIILVISLIIRQRGRKIKKRLPSSASALLEKPLDDSQENQDSADSQNSQNSQMK